MFPLLCIAAFLFALGAFASVRLPTSVLAPLLVIAVPLPFIFSIIGVFPDGENLYIALQVIELSDSTPTVEDLASDGMVSLTIVFAGLVLSLPTYALAMIVLMYRAFVDRGSAVEVR